MAIIDPSRNLVGEYTYLDRHILVRAHLILVPSRSHPQVLAGWNAHQGKRDAAIIAC